LRRATRTIHKGGRLLLIRRKDSRRSRLARFLSTASLSYLRPTTTPRRHRPSGAGRVLSSISLPGWLEPVSRIVVHSAPLVSRLSRPKLASPICSRPAGCRFSGDSSKESDAAELVTAFLTTAGEDLAAARGGHASAETDVVDALDFGGLEGAFHVHFSLSWWILPTLHQ
jgi:hypothetical protein